MASGKLTGDDSPREWAIAFLGTGIAMTNDGNIKLVEGWFREAILEGIAAYRRDVEETLEGKVHVEGHEPDSQGVRVHVWHGHPSTETDPREWAREFMKFNDQNAGRPEFDDVTDWFRHAIEAGVNAHKTKLKTIEAMQAEVLENNAERGWLDEPYSFGDCIANLHGEVSEAWEAWRKWGLTDMTPNTDALKFARFITDPPKPDGVGSEFADIFIRLLDDCERFGVNLREEYERKMAFNRTRPYRHGNKKA